MTNIRVSEMSLRKTTVRSLGQVVAISGLALSAAAQTPLPASQQGLQIRQGGSQPSVKGADANFTGQVRIDPLFAAQDPARAGGGTVTFEPGARTVWHTHPLGQILVVTAGLGWVQREGGPVQEIRPGDVVWIPPGVKHWHGATKTTGMTHIAITENANGKVVDWLEKVSDEKYGKQQ